MPSVLIVSSGEDTGGVGYSIVRAFRRFPSDWTVRFVRRADNYIQYPADIQWLPGDDGTEKVVRGLVQEADVIHHFQKWIMTLDGWESKSKVLHHHGTGFRRSPAAWVVEAVQYGAKSICSTMDLVAHDPENLVWMPNPHDLAALAEIRKVHYRPSRVLRIAHAPTNQAGKSTRAFLAACERLRRETEIEVDLITKTSWENCLIRKAKADIYYDQVLVAYGNNAVEAWAMGIPVIAGVDPVRGPKLGIPVPPATRDEMLRTWGTIPFVEATEDTIYDALKLLTDPVIRQSYGQLGFEHAWRWHDDWQVVQRLSAIYEAAAR